MFYESQYVSALNLLWRIQTSCSDIFTQPLTAYGAHHLAFTYCGTLKVIIRRSAWQRTLSWSQCFEMQLWTWNRFFTRFPQSAQYSTSVHASVRAFFLWEGVMYCTAVSVSITNRGWYETLCTYYTVIGVLNNLVNSFHSFQICDVHNTISAIIKTQPFITVFARACSYFQFSQRKGQSRRNTCKFCIK